MAGGVFSTAKLAGMTIRESATDGSDFTNPDADYRRLFLGEDGQLHVKDSAGAVTDIGAGTGTDLQPGTSFPGGPSTNDLCFRTDRGLLYYYDGTRWLTLQEFALPLTIADALQGTNTPPVPGAAIDEGDNGAYVTRLKAWTYQAGGATASNYTTFQLRARNAAGTTQDLGSTFSSQNDTLGQFTGKTVTIGTVVTSGYTNYYINGTKTNSPTGIYCVPTVFYRLIG